MANRLIGKVAVVTGAASGMGKQIALAYLNEGACVFAVDLNEARLEELKKEVSDKALSDKFDFMVGNITSSGDCEAAVEKCVSKFGICNVLSHNAGVIDDFTMVDELEDEKWDKVLAVNLTGSMKITRAVLKYFVANEIKGSIVMITSNAAFESATGGPAYCASKAGANALMKSIAFEYMRNGIRCNSICPGPIATNITESAPFEMWNKRGCEVHLMSGYNAMQQVWTGKQEWPSDSVAPLAVYLASDESAIMNGNSCVADGGVCLSR